MDNQPAAEATLKDLQEEAVKLGMPEEDAKKFTSKAPLQATVNALKALKAEQQPASLEEQTNPKEDKDIEKKWNTKADRMLALLHSQPKVRIKLSLEGKETQGDVKMVVNPRNGMEQTVYVSGTVVPVNLNGCTWHVPKGRYVDVPQQVADVLDETDRQTAEAGKSFLLDRIDPQTGKPVRDQL